MLSPHFVAAASCWPATLLFSTLISAQSMTSKGSSALAFDEVTMNLANVYQAPLPEVRAFVGACLKHQEMVGIPAAVMVAMAIHESGLNSRLYRNSGNPFGLKAGPDWKGAVYYQNTGDTYTAYRKYSTPEAAVLDFGLYINRRAWYQDVFLCPLDDFEGVVHGLEKTEEEPGYSVNPNWGKHILRLIDTYWLDKLPVQRTLPDPSYQRVTVSDTSTADNSVKVWYR